MLKFALAEILTAVKQHYLTLTGIYSTRRNWPVLRSIKKEGAYKKTPEQFQ